MRLRWVPFAFLFSAAIVLAQQESSPAQSTSSAAESKESSKSPEAAPLTVKPDLTPGPDGKLTQAQMRELTRVVAKNYRSNYNLERDYTFIRRDIEHNVDGSGQIKSTDTKTFEVLQIYGEQVWRLIEKNDKPLDSKEAAKEDEKIQKIIDKHKNESEEEHRKYEERQAKARDEERKFVSEVADTYDFTLVGTEVVDGREAWVIDGQPRPGFEPNEKDAKFLSKFRGRMWIDQADLQLAKLDVEAIDTASVGWVLARIHKGTRFDFERTRMTDEIWLPRHLSYKLDARVALFKGYKVEGDSTFRDYKKFRTSSKIVGMGEVHDPQ
jgi:hypothetical protein